MKPRFVFTLGLLLAAVALSSWFLYKDEIKHAIQPEDSHIPDYTLDNFVYDAYTPQGQLDYRIIGVYMEHLPDGDLFRITGLDLNTYNEGRLSWSAKARKANLQGKSQDLALSGDVQITYFGQQQTQPIRMQTEAMTVYSKRHYAENRLPTVFSFAGGNVQSQGGFQLDGKARTLKMFGGVAGEIQHD